MSLRLLPQKPRELYASRQVDDLGRTKPRWDQLLPREIRRPFDASCLYVRAIPYTRVYYRETRAWEHPGKADLALFVSTGPSSGLAQRQMSGLCLPGFVRLVASRALQPRYSPQEAGKESPACPIKTLCCGLNPARHLTPSSAPSPLQSIGNHSNAPNHSNICLPLSSWPALAPLLPHTCSELKPYRSHNHRARNARSLQRVLEHSVI